MRQDGHLIETFQAGPFVVRYVRNFELGKQGFKIENRTEIVGDVREVRFPDKFWRRSTHLSFAAKGLYAVLATFADYRKERHRVPR